MASPGILPAVLAVATLACLASPALAQRKLALAQSPCPEKRAATACKSFEELLRDNDAGLTNDLAHQDHVYVCFLPNIDEFFKVTWSDPSSAAFAAPSPAQIKQGAPAAALIAPGATEFDYFRSGVRDSDSSVHDSGIWTSLPPAPLQSGAGQQPPDARPARFQGKAIEISSDEWKLTETYPNDTGARTRHTVTLQLATGRFRQEFALADSGKIQAQNTGRCLIAPSLPDP